MEEDDLFYPDEFEEIDRAILNRATSRLSELLPKWVRCCVDCGSSQPADVLIAFHA